MSEEDLLVYKRELFNAISIDSESNQTFPEESFFEYVSDLLSNAGILDDVQYCPYRDSRKGLKIDGYSWNSLEKTVCGIILDFTNDPDKVGTLTKTEIDKLGKRVTKFFENVGNNEFLETLEVTDPGRLAAAELDPYMQDAIKCRVVVMTDQVLSARVKKVHIESILDKDSSIEIWDLERLLALERSDTEYEEFTVNLEALGGAVRALPANLSKEGMSTYLCVMPGTLLSNIYDEFGQRLLESNVRTFLDFRATTNRGMRKSLLTEPDRFFAYNNGITVTASSVSTEQKDGQLLVTALENMQIVNGGQTTAAIYFSPKEKGGIKGRDKTHLYSDIDLSKVYVQMKLTIVGDKETADVVKANIATFANSQNSIQQSDLVSNHSFHLSIETRSRKQLMPAGVDGISTKWFYERARGQYSTQLRALSARQKTRFQTEYPKKQVFTKIDMAKYENTWRMNPHIVKKGAQANLKALGHEIIKEFEKDEAAFGAAFYNDLVSKIILFRQCDAAVLKADWYQDQRGLKAEVVTYSIALLRHALIKKGRDIDLDSIYRHQRVSETTLSTVVTLAQRIREKITDPEFTGGVTNPSEFCKSESGWRAIQALEVDLGRLADTDVLTRNQKKDLELEKKGLDQVGESLNNLELVMSISADEWQSIASHYAETYPDSHKNVGIPRKCVQLLTMGRMLSEKQLESAVQIRSGAYEDGFDYVS